MRVLSTNIVDDLFREPARPGRHAFQTLKIAQNLTTYSSNSKLHVIKAPRLSAGAFGQENRLPSYTKRCFFVLQMENY